VDTPVLKGQRRARNQILYGRGYQHFAGLSEGRDAGSDMNGDPAEVVAYDLALARVQTGSNLDPERLDAVRDGASTADGPGRAVESGEKTIAGGPDLAAAEAHKLPAN
jgi:hypothetical protein